MAKISVALILVLFATLFTFSEATPLQQPETKGVCLVYFRFKIFNIFHISALQFWLVQSTWTILLQWWLLQYRTKLLYFLWLQKMYISKLWWLLQDCTWIKWVIEKHNIFRNFKCISQHIVNFYKDFILFWIFIDIGNKSVLHPKKICCIVAPTSFHIYLSTFQKFYRKVYISWYKNGTYLLDQINLQKMI